MFILNYLICLRVPLLENVGSKELANTIAKKTMVNRLKVV